MHTSAVPNELSPLPQTHQPPPPDSVAPIVDLPVHWDLLTSLWTCQPSHLPDLLRSHYHCVNMLTYGTRSSEPCDCRSGPENVCTFIVHSTPNPTNHNCRPAMHPILPISCPRRIPPHPCGFASLRHPSNASSLPDPDKPRCRPHQHPADLLAAPILPTLHQGPTRSLDPSYPSPYPKLFKIRLPALANIYTAIMPSTITMLKVSHMVVDWMPGMSVCGPKIVLSLLWLVFLSPLLVILIELSITI